MSKRYPGGIIRKTPQTPSQTSAQGIWDMASVTQAVKENTWPIAGVPDPISRSLRFRASASANLTRTVTTSGSLYKFTQSLWVKRGVLSTQQAIGMTNFNGTYAPFIRFNATTDVIAAYVYYDGSSWTGNLITNAVYRDPAAWYHIVLSVDTTQAVASDRIKLYVNGAQVTSLSTANYPAQNSSLIWNTVNGQAGYPQIGGNSYFDGYLAEYNYIDGQQLTPSSFGNTNDQTGVWQPIAYTGTYGTNGFYLPFSNTASTATLGNDFSGNSNNWTPNNISLTSGSTYDSMVDVPTRWIPYNTTGDVGALWRGNYCVFNPLNKSTVGTATASGGNLNIFLDRSSDNPWMQTTFALPTSGKWYFEFVQTAADTTSVAWTQIGVMDITTPQQTSVTSVTGQRAYRMGNGFKVTGTTSASYGNAFALNDILGVAIDMDSGKMWFAKNNTWQVSGDPVAGTNATFTDLSGTTWSVYAGLAGQTTANGSINFGQRPFSYTPPSGFKTLCTTNLPTPTIGATASTTANKYFNPVIWTGTGGTRSITGVGFQPDFVWAKARSQAYSNIVFDSNRGVGKSLLTDTTGAEATNEANGYISSFDTDGFSSNFSAAANYYFNENGTTYVAWNWRANQGTNVTNTAGSITSTVSANTTAGFSVVTFTGNGNTAATVGHGLGVAPRLIILKDRQSTASWLVYHASVTDTTFKYLVLNSTAAVTTNASTVWGAALPTSSVFGVNCTQIGGSTNNFVAYCFSEVAGYSAFGSYTGNGSTDGPFVFTGFRPKFIMLKNSTSAASWSMLDTSRNTYNISNARLFAESSQVEDTSQDTMDILSNGFKLRATGLGVNGSGSTIIYMAFAESPFKYAFTL